MEQQIRAIEKKLAELLQHDPSYFLVEVKINPGNNVKVFVDADEGAGIDKLVKYNRSLYKHIEESDLFANSDFSLEVSSPGLEEPLKLHRQYIKNIGREVEVIQKDGIRIEGKLVSAGENEIVLEEEKAGVNNKAGLVKLPHGRPTGKKKELVQHTILIENIKHTKIQIKF